VPGPGLYPIVDVDALRERGLDPVAFAERVLEATPPLLQLRAKSLGARDTLALLRALRPLAERSGTELFANDRPDLALLAATDGVHLGQCDLPLPEARRLVGKLKVGVSTHDFAELEAALALGPAYVAFGPVFPTASKSGHEPTVGLERLARAGEKARAAGVPLVAIGGITLDNVAGVLSHVSFVAVIGALVPWSGALGEVSDLTVALAACLSAPGA